MRYKFASFYQISSQSSLHEPWYLELVFRRMTDTLNVESALLLVSGLSPMSNPENFEVPEQVL